MKNIILAICYGFGVGLNSLIGISCTTSSSVEIENNIDPHIITPVYVALQQRNLEQLKARLTNFSDPTSEHYGQWLDRETISQTISPTLDRQAEVLSWINQYQVVNVENYGDAIKFYANPLTIRDMFNIGQKENLVGYTIPYHLTDIVSFVEMTRSIKLNHLKTPKKKNYRNLDNVTDDRYFGSEPLRRLYNVSEINLNHRISGGLIEYQNNDGFTNQDLNLQQVVNGQRPNNLTIIVGDNHGYDDESQLDVQLMSQAADGIRLWYWNSPYWLYSFAVDFYQAEDIPQVISMSWGWSEDSQCEIIDCPNITSQQYVERVNNEYLKIALRGTTILAASGDAGAPGRTDEGCSPERPINPIFPGSSPYVLSIGGTVVSFDNQTLNYTTPLCLNNSCLTGRNETSISCDKIGWTAGGGFDIYHNETPYWQRKAVTRYLKSGVTLPNSSNFNQNGRAYPDVSAIGHSCPTYINKRLDTVDGTSCSTPVVAGLVSIIANHLWVKNGVKTGFINPLLYYIWDNCPECFQDITEGYNWCTENSCCDNHTDYGFQATKGFDPVTGLGTLNLGRIISYLDSLH